MSVFKCKMCGGTIEFEQGATVGVCDSCGTKQTLPRLDDDKKANLYDRANHFRRSNDFDKAMSIYEQILNEDNTDAEAYWSLVICRYGIEYVEDPVSHKRVPTVNRAQFTSIFADEDYKSALQYADDYQKSIYEEEARAIDEIQKGILAISQREEPFDVFICYKDTDNNGRRTQDSVLANDLYHQLTQEGFKVFFSRITLEDKLGTAYEPYIFAALNSSKVMVVLGTRPEFFNAVWVKNEWSRYLALIKNGEKKMLIPAYRDMDPYDLPEEFSHLQAQDMSRLGFMQDLIRGIKKIISIDTPKTGIKESTVLNSGNNNITPLLKRAFMFLEDGAWDKADDFCEQVLNQDPENAEAYLGKLMAELNVRRREDLKEQTESFENKDNYGKVLRFADNALEAEMQGYVKDVKKRSENARLTGIYNNAKKAMEAANSEGSYKSAADLFSQIRNFEDADDLAKLCLENAEVCRKEEEHKAFERRIAAEKAAKKRKKAFVIGIPIVVVGIALLLVLNMVIIPEVKYNKAISLHDNGEFSEAYKMFASLNEYKDSSIKASEVFEQNKSELIREQLKTSEIGDTVLFGTYEQDNDASNGKEDIEWIILAKENEKVLMISKYALDCKKYNSSLEDITWEKCSLRTWMNESFLNEAFSYSEQEKILTINNTEDNSENDTNSDSEINDRVFLLSITEVEKYFDTDAKETLCSTTRYAKEQGVKLKKYSIISQSERRPDAFTGSYCAWWLRSLSSVEKYAATITFSGRISPGAPVAKDNIGVRPAMWINLE